MGRGALERSLSRPAFAHTINDIGPLLSHGLKHFGKQLGGVLQVSIDDQDRVASA